MLILSNKTYDFAKRLVQVVLPAIGALYFGLGQIWGFPEIENVVGSISVITVFLGTVLGISHSTYKNSDAAYDGKIVAKTEGDNITYSLELDDIEPEEILGMQSVRFRVLPVDKDL